MTPGMQAVRLVKTMTYGRCSRARKSASNRSTATTKPIDDARMIASLRLGINVPPLWLSLNPMGLVVERQPRAAPETTS
jgi:hypothetical protein